MQFLSLCFLIILAATTSADGRLTPSKQLQSINSTIMEKNDNIILIIVKFIRGLIPKETVTKIRMYIKTLPETLSESLIALHDIIFNAEDISIGDFIQCISKVATALISTIIAKINQIVDLFLPIGGSTPIEFMLWNEKEFMKGVK